MSSAHGTERKDVPRLAVIGGGMAGIAAAEAASREGWNVDLFEWSGVLGGRAASLFDPIAKQWIDNGQHLSLGCCTELLALQERLGLNRFFQRKDSIPFAQLGGKRWIMAASPFLPNRWQLAPAFMKIPFLSFKDRLSTGLLVRKLGKIRSGSEPTDSFARWLASEGASRATIDHFWAPLIYSALSETVDNVSFDAVRKVVRDGFLAGKDAMAVYLPTAPLRTIYHDAVVQRFRELGLGLHFHAKVRRLHWAFSEGDDAEDEKPRITALELSDGSERVYDRYLLAVPAHRSWKILENSDLEPFAEQLGLDRFEPGAITTVHLWFERRLLPPEHSHTALLGGPGQFLFCPHQEAGGDSPGVYHTVVVSASHRLLSDDELTSHGSAVLIDRVVEQLRSTFPEAFRKVGETENVLRHRRVTTFFDAVFSPSPTVYPDRPSQETPFSNLALAGDWTQTDWPSTLEGAVRSGLRAVDVLRED